MSSRAHGTKWNKKQIKETNTMKMSHYVWLFLDNLEMKSQRDTHNIINIIILNSYDINIYSLNKLFGTVFFFLFLMLSTLKRTRWIRNIQFSNYYLNLKIFNVSKWTLFDLISNCFSLELNWRWISSITYTFFFYKRHDMAPEENANRKWFKILFEKHKKI